MTHRECPRRGELIWEDSFNFRGVWIDVYRCTACQRQVFIVDRAVDDRVVA